MAVQRFLDSRQIVTSPGVQAPSQGSVPEPSPSIAFDSEPLWAYGFPTPPKPGDVAVPQALPTRALRPNEDPEEQLRPQRVAGSRAEYSLIDIRDPQQVADWFPNDHPPMPDIIARGPSRLTTTRRGCGFCHLPNGRGRPENAPVGDLPIAYFIGQIQDFRNGLRHSADPRKPNTITMIDLAKAMTDGEIAEAARYFSAIRWAPWIRVVETALVPETVVVNNLFLAPNHNRTEPIDGRIIEVPEVLQQAETLRNPRSGFVAYVPPGSIEKGRDLVTTGGMRIVGDTIVQGRTTPCVTCHGLDLMGVADVPPIAGRSPSYIVRQMWDIQQGTRRGAAVQLMKLAISKLLPEDLVAVAAYVSSRRPDRRAS